MTNEISERNRRRHYLIDKSFQFTYLFDHVTVGLAAAVASVLTLFFLVFFQLSEKRIYHSAWSSTLFWDLGLLFVLLVLLALYRGLLRSHRIAGPAYRFRQACRQVAQGDLTASFRLRRKDQLKDVAQAFQEMTLALRDLADRDREAVAGAKAALAELQSLVSAPGFGEARQERLATLAAAIEQHLDAIGKHYILSLEERAGRE